MNRKGETYHDGWSGTGTFGHLLPKGLWEQESAYGTMYRNDRLRSDAVTRARRSM
jgi:hypothetical protein